MYKNVPSKKIDLLLENKYLTTLYAHFLSALVKY